MTITQKRTTTISLLLTLASAFFILQAGAQTQHHHTSGSFAPNVKPLPADFPSAPNLGRMTISKTLHGGIEATTTGQMLTAMTDVKGSAGYVAVEQIDGTVDGHKGTFTLIQLGIMDHGKPNLNVTVVPDSGTGELAGLAGTLSINIAADGKHTYTFDYTLPDAPAAH